MLSVNYDDGFHIESRIGDLADKMICMPAIGKNVQEFI